MKNNKKGFSIIIAMGLVVLISLLALSILEYIIPFSKNVKGIENSAGSYYNAVSAVENALWFINTNSLGTNKPAIISTTATGFNYNIIANGSILPPIGKGNSDFNKNWNKVSSGNPIQLEIGNGQINSNWANFKLYIKVPDIDNGGPIIEAFSGTQDIIQWQLSSQSGSLNASGSYIKGNDVNDSNLTNKIVTFNTRNGVKLDGTPKLIPGFYTTNCLAGKSCILKLSVINKLEWETGFTGGTLPYLEWQLKLSPDNIPLRYTNIEANGKSFGFIKQLNLRVPQKTTIDAFNFTIFQ